MKTKMEEKMGTSMNTNGTTRVFNLIILDESGSMSAIYRPALSGVNETLQTIRSSQEENPGQQHFVSLVTFDTEHYNRVYNCTPASIAKELTNDQYRPFGGTPLYDAMGNAIMELEKQVNKEDVVLVTIITDGYENASSHFNGASIKELVERKKADDWVFTYIGANQDVMAVSAMISIDNYMAFQADEEGTHAMFAKEQMARKKFNSRLNEPCCNREELKRGYFNEE